MKRNITIVAGTLFLNVTAWFSWWLLLPIYLRELGASEIQIGISYTALNLAFAFGSLAGGFLGDKFGRRPLIVIPTYLFVILYLLASQAQRWPVLVGLLISVWFVSGILDPSFCSIIAESVPGRRKGIAFGIMQMSFSVGLVLGPFLGSFLIRKFSMSYLMLLTAIVALVSAVIRSWGLKETISSSKPQKVSGLQPENVLFNKNLIWILLGNIFLWILFYLTVWGPFISLHAKDFIGLSKPQINLLFSVGGISSAVFSLLGGRVIDKIGSKLVFIISTILHPLAFIPWLFTTNLVSGIPYFIWAYLFYQSGYIACRVIVSDLTTPAVRARVFGVFGAITGIIGAFAPSVGMTIKTRFGPSAPFVMALGIGILSALCLFFVSYKTNTNTIRDFQEKEME